MNARYNLLRALFFVELFRQPETYHVTATTLIVHKTVCGTTVLWTAIMSATSYNMKIT